MRTGKDWIIVRGCVGVQSSELLWGLNMWPFKQEEGAAGMSQRFVWGRLPRKRVAVMACCVRSFCQYETNKLVRIQSVRLGSMKWSLNGFILLFIWWAKVPQSAGESCTSAEETRICHDEPRTSVRPRSTRNTHTLQRLHSLPRLILILVHWFSRFKGRLFNTVLNHLYRLKMLTIWSKCPRYEDLVLFSAPCANQRSLICVLASVMMLWNRKYQEFDLVVSSVTTKVKGVAQTNLPGVGEVVWDVVDYSGPAAQVEAQASSLVDPRIIGGFKVFQFIVSEQKLFFCVDQRHRNAESEAGEMPRGALPSYLIKLVLLISFLVGKIVLCCCSFYIPGSPERQIVSQGPGLQERLFGPAQSRYRNLVSVIPDSLLFIGSAWFFF